MGTPLDPRVDGDTIAPPRARYKALGQRDSIKKMQCDTENKILQKLERECERTWKLHMYGHIFINCPLDKVAQRWTFMVDNLRMDAKSRVSHVRFSLFKHTNQATTLPPID